MKRWALAVVLSLAVHLGVVASFELSPSPPVGESVGERVDAVVSFTTVSLEPKKALAPAAALEKPRAARASLAPVGEVTTGILPGERELGAPAAEAEGDAMVAPHPDPLPAGAEREKGPDVTALVHARLAAMADRCYPAAARRFQQRGTVQLSFCTDANGGAASTSVTQSSGAALLDAAARGCVVESAAPFPPEAASRCFSVPVRFGALPQ